MQKFATPTPHYPGVRAPVDAGLAAGLLDAARPLLDAHFGSAGTRWSIAAWHSIVTRAPRDLLPIQRFPHVDGVDGEQVAMMLYLNRTAHGGTAFFRHVATGFEALTATTFPLYKASLEAEVARNGLPAAAYVTDGAPFFERIHEAEPRYNRAVFYRGNVFHSGVIDGALDLPADPRLGRYTINAFFTPRAG